MQCNLLQRKLTLLGDRIISFLHFATKRYKYLKDQVWKKKPFGRCMKRTCEISNCLRVQVNALPGLSICIKEWGNFTIFQKVKDHFIITFCISAISFFCIRKLTARNTVFLWFQQYVKFEQQNSDWKDFSNGSRLEMHQKFWF